MVSLFTSYNARSCNGDIRPNSACKSWNAACAAVDAGLALGDISTAVLEAVNNGVVCGAFLVGLGLSHVHVAACQWRF